MQNSQFDPGTKAEETTGGDGIIDLGETFSKGGGKGGLKKEEAVPGVDESDKNSAGGSNSGVNEETDSAGGSVG